MLTEDYVDSWNQLFPDCQINNSSLANPTEGFLINALVCYLRRFGYKIEPPFDLSAETKENNKETRSFLIKLTRQIDCFLKITDKIFSFSYYDLIRPTPKKTAHMLYILLNYFYYYNVYKEDVFKMANEKILKLEDLKNRIVKTRCDNEHRQQENINIKSTIEILMKDVPLARTKLKELEQNRTQQDAEFEKINHSCRELKEKLKHLEDQKKSLRKRVVAKEEFQELKNQLEQLKNNLAEQKEIELNNLTNLNECKESNAMLQNFIKEVKKSSEVIPAAIITQVKETNEQMAQAQNCEHVLKLNRTNILKEIEEENEKKLTMENEEISIKHKIESKQKDMMNTINEKQSTLEQKDAEIFRLEEQDHISDCKLEEQKDISQYLKENLSEILSCFKE